MTQQYSDAFLDEHRDINVHHEWWDSVYDDFNEICKILGIELNEREPCFSGFWSQGDGASWAGRYRAQGLNYPGLAPLYTYDLAPAKIREYAGDEKLHEMADRLCLLARIYGPVYAKVGRSSNHYVHDSTMQIDEWEFYDDERNEDVPPEIAEHIETELLDVFRDLAGWLYATLEREYDHLTSDEAVADTLEANEIEEEKEEEEV
jgi:hypothetical protein